MNPTRELAVDAPPGPVTAAGARPIEMVVIPIVEEQAHVGKREIDGDRVRVTTRTDTVEEHVSQNLRIDQVQVTRVPVGRTLAAGEPAPVIRTEGNVTIVPVVEEIVVVEKRFVLKEEIHILREVTTETVDVPVTLRKQRAVIERTSADGEAAGDNEGDHHGLT